MFDEQIKLFPNATETAAALYWRGRLYEQDNNRSQAAQIRIACSALMMPAPRCRPHDAST